MYYRLASLCVEKLAGGQNVGSNQSNKRLKPAEEGENVTVPIPEVDRGRLDPPNLTAVVQEHDSETGLHMILIGNKYVMKTVQSFLR